MKKFKTIIAVCMVAVMSLCCGVLLAACGTPDPTATVNGYVTDSTGDFIAGAKVKIGDKEAVTDETGKYEIAGLPHEAFVVKASKDGYFEGEKSVPLEELVLLDEKANLYSCQADVNIEKFATLSGTVTDNNKKPIEGVTVSIGDKSGKTDAQGKYTVTGFRADKGMTAKAEKEGYYTKSSPVSFATGVFEKALSYTLAQIGKVVVSVYDSDGTTPLAATVSVNNEIKMTTDSNATVEFGQKSATSGIAVGANPLNVTAEGYVSFTKEITAEDFVKTETPPTYTVKVVMEKEYLPGAGKNLIKEEAEKKVLTGDYYGLQFFRSTDEKAAIFAPKTQDIRDGWAIMGGTATHQEGLELAASGEGSESAEKFYSYVYGKATIGDAKTMMTVSARRYDSAQSALVAVYVMEYDDNGDLGAPQVVAPMGAANGRTDADINTYYTRVNYDLSAYKDKDVVIAVGNRKSQFNLNMITFSDKAEQFIDLLDNVKMSVLEKGSKDLGASSYVQVATGQDGISGQWGIFGRVENKNEGASLTFAEREHLNDAEATKLHDFLYGKKAMDGIVSIDVTCRTFMDQVNDHNTVAPKVGIVLVNADTGAATLVGTHTYSTDEAAKHTFTISTPVTGNYYVLIGTMNGYHGCVSDITFNTGAAA